MNPTPEMIEAAKEIADKITKAMEGVTAGLWETVTERENPLRLHVVGQSNIVDGLDGVCEATRSNDRSFAEDVANMRYIAACNPANMRVILSALSGSLALLPVEPVAWRYRHVPTVSWSYASTKHPRTDLEQEALYTSPTPHPSLDRDALLEEARMVLEPFVLVADAILAEAPADAGYYSVFMDCEGKSWRLTTDQLRAARSLFLKLEGSSHAKD
jgi:hypothetical protein